MAKVFVGMSGGIDSSVSAYLLKAQGHEVTGLFMKNWEEADENGVCRSTLDYEDAAKVCSQLNIPLYTVNFVQEYWDLVFQQFIEELKLGYTPNPDILCNKEIKFQAFFQKAKSLGADFVATGHYCQTHEGQLFKGADPSKDQSYFLHAISHKVLPEVLFPVGHLTKNQVRQIAKEQNLATKDKKDSTGICFIGKRNFKEFISHYIPYQSGDFRTLNGEYVGKHDGAAYYTIGQRKGLGIGGPGDAWFVVGKDKKQNIVYLEQGQDHPALYAQNLIAVEPTFIDERCPLLPFKCRAKIRYRQEDQECLVESTENGQLAVFFSTPQRAITPRQSIVFYQGDLCLGGAFIEKTFN